MKIRHAKNRDAEEIKKVARKSWRNAYQGILSRETVDQVVNQWYDVKTLREETEDPIFYVAEKEGKVVGFVHARLNERKASLERIYLDPEHQRGGIGSKLYRKMENELPEKVEKIELEVISENDKGRNFYLKKGFKEVREEKIELKGEEVMQKVMEKELS